MSAEKRQNTGNVPIATILRTYVKAAKRYPIAVTMTYVCYALGTLGGDVLIRLYYRDVFDFLVEHPASPTLWPELKHMLLMIFTIIVSYNAFWRAADFFIAYSESNIMRDLTNDTLAKLQRHSYSFFIGNFTGGLVTKVRRFVRAFETIMDKTVFTFWQTGIGVVGIVVVLWFQAPLLALIFTLWFFAYVGLSFLLVRYRMRFDLVAAAADSAVTGELADSITNILNIKMFSSSAREMQRFAGTTMREYKARLRAWFFGNGLYATQAATMTVLEITGMTLALRLWSQGSITTGTVVLVQSYLIMVITHTWEIGRAISDIFKSLSDASEMAEILRTPLEVSDPKVSEKIRIAKGSIALDSMGFGYGEGRPVFQNFTLHIPAGQRVGIVGHSGAGKSTLFKLLLRFLDVTNGSITVDGQDLRNVTQDDLRSKISYVPQDPILFHRSLFENIAYAKPGATEDEVIAAAKRAHAHEFIVGLPKGYDTLVGERGVKLSGGERQRVAIARVILKNAPILLLDEATSSLDSISEKYVQEQLKELMQGSTTLAIAHRISTVTQMDRIIVLNGGRIIEDGTHAQLLAKKGIYATLWEHQSQGFLKDGDEEEGVSVNDIPQEDLD